MTAYCRDCDPLILAGRTTCPTCRVTVWPRDAEWLDDRLILAVYAPTCDHTRDLLIVVDPEQMSPAPRTRCDSLRRNGQPCRAYAVTGSPWCRAHGGRRKAVR